MDVCVRERKERQRRDVQENTNQKLLYFRLRILLSSAFQKEASKNLDNQQESIRLTYHSADPPACLYRT